jgi:hypothetical protein
MNAETSLLARSKITAKELLNRYSAGERDFSFVDSPSADLGRADLRGADLSNANLYTADLSNADLSEANLGGAELTGANLSRVNLRGAHLRKARLKEVNLKYADLTDADLTGANLRLADMNGASLERTNIDDVTCFRTLWANVNLGSVIGLERVRHDGPSTVGLDTLLNSAGRIPDAFLRGCGVPEHIIDLQKSLVEGLSPIQFYSCFISYSHQNEEFAKRLHARLQQEGLRVWYAPEEMKAGRKLHEQIDEAIRVHDKLLLVLSEASMKSEWVGTEISKARKRERKEGKQVLFPVRLVEFQKIQEWECFDADAGKDSAREIREFYVPDFSNWKEHDAFEAEVAKLLRDLRASVG